jgi:hypothetical protein
MMQRYCAHDRAPITDPGDWISSTSGDEIDSAIASTSTYMPLYLRGQGLSAPVGLQHSIRQP